MTANLSPEQKADEGAGRVPTAPGSIASGDQAASHLVPPGNDPIARASFRLTDNPDPEERLEEAALWKAMHDEYGDAIYSTNSERATFGRASRNQPVGELPYWNDPAFLAHCQRRFSVVAWTYLHAAVGELHEDGLGAFVKSTRGKHAIFRVPVGADPDDEIGDMAYSFMDGGPSLMVQELATVEYEYRWFVIDRQIVTSSPNAVPLTPIDFPYSRVWQAPSGAGLDIEARVYIEEFAPLVERVAAEMQCPHAVIDTAYINGRAGIVEFNPMILGSIGLFACDVRALAKASRLLPQRPPAQAIEARSGETRKAWLDPTDESAVPSGMRPTPAAPGVHP